MMTQELLLKVKPVSRTILVDLSLTGAVCMLPALHVIAPWVGQLSPMLLLLLAGMAMVGDRRNAFLLALAMPLLSMLAVGLPTPAKALCMAPELLTVVSVYTFLERKMQHNVVSLTGAMLAAVVSGKIVYYALKAMLIAPVALISTPVAMQALVAFCSSALFAGIVVRKG